MKELLQKLLAHQGLSRDEARDLLLDITRGTFSDPAIAAIMTSYLAGRIHADELAGFCDALYELCEPVELNGLRAIDMCGTGGDGKNTFNISTTAAFVVAGAGYKVCKHGNYGVSSPCGSSNVIESLHYRFPQTGEEVIRELESIGISFLHAPFFHPALKSVAGVRKILGVKTFFNMLGPLVNPARPQHQLVGVFSLELVRLYSYLLDERQVEYCIVYSLDGYDEVSLTAPVKITGNRTERILYPADLGLAPVQPEQLGGGSDVMANRKILLSILQGQATKAQEHVVLANAALAIQCFNRDRTIGECYQEAVDSLHSGRALGKLNSLIAQSKIRA